MTVWVEIDLCDGCGICVRACPYEAMEIKDGKSLVLDRCTSCGACIDACRQTAILNDFEPRKIPDFTGWKGVWVFSEQRDGKLSRVSLELLGKARELAQKLGHEVSAVLPGWEVSGLCGELIKHGADNVFLAEHPDLKYYDTIAYASVLEKMIKKYRPNIFLMGATPLGRDLAPRASRRVCTGLTADCTELEIDPEEGILLQTRPAFGGNIMATIVNRYSRPQMATVRPGVMEIVFDRTREGKVISWKIDVPEKALRTEIIEFFREERNKVNLSEAKVIVAGGRGVESAAGFDMLRELARVMGGEVAGTRVTVEEGWIPAENQVGQTGQSVRPDIYVACGISGAVQHRAGMINSRYVIAINKDPGAPIFKVADWGIVGDLHEMVPEMIRQLKMGGASPKEPAGV
ncbi:MAG: electron transfer flavoprotein subunit alpha [Desulfobacterales bacterium]|nr:electron transfer flavoprotein subunit alpha [Desulfobacterales bacterium]